MMDEASVWRRSIGRRLLLLGSLLASTTCAPTASCVPTAVCGDGVVGVGESCDDANTNLGDGCDVFCQREPVCTNGTCTAVCGDGVRLPGETCDDGNALNGDGCSSTCQHEVGFTCTNTVLDPPHVDVATVYRDFRGQDLDPPGHPDFERVDPGTGVVQGIVQGTLGADGKPVFIPGSTTTVTSAATFDQWYRDTPGVNLTIRDHVRLARSSLGTYVFDDAGFFPLDGLGWVATGQEPPRSTDQHNYHFTSELRYWFRYAGNEVLEFRGDDDVWVFINRRLALDLGGLHDPAPGLVRLDASRAAALGLTVGGIYEVAVFQAERHTWGSSYQVTLRNFASAKTGCTFICGDGIVTPAEVCDDGVNDGTVGSCTPDCLGFGTTRRLPDLVVKSIELTGPATVNDTNNAVVPIRVVVRNQGDAAAGIFKVSTSYTNGPDTFLVAFTVPFQQSLWYPYTSGPLAPQDEVAFAGLLTFNSARHGISVTVRALADSCAADEFMPPHCRVEEHDETNNESTSLVVALP